jgi:hypothetical protein
MSAVLDVLKCFSELSWTILSLTLLKKAVQSFEMSGAARQMSSCSRRLIVRNTAVRVSDLTFYVVYVCNFFPHRSGSTMT